MKKTTGVVIGKFMPLHAGHIYMITSAKNIVNELTVLVDNLPTEVETMDLDSRVSIVSKTFPDVIVKGIDEITMQTPEESEHFWEYWKSVILRNVGYNPDFIIGSEDYIKELANILECDFIMIDKKRTKFPISATKIRNAYKEYELGNKEELENVIKFIPPETKSYFSKNIFIVGGESTGKTTLANKLSKSLNTVLIPEYATFFINEVSRLLSKKDLLNIAITQLGYQKTLKKESFFYAVHDTDLITTKIWYKKFFGEEGIEVFNEIIEKQEDGLYLLLNNNNEWKEDNHRYFPNDEDRKWFLNQFIIELENYNKKYILIENRNVNEILKLIN